MDYSAQEKYDSQNTVRFTIKLNKKTDKEIIDFLLNAKNKQGTIKKILKEYCKNH